MLKSLLAPLLHLVALLAPALKSAQGRRSGNKNFRRREYLWRVLALWFDALLTVSPLPLANLVLVSSTAVPTFLHHGVRRDGQASLAARVVSPSRFFTMVDE
jgi:hypothetical protein